ncbi:dihydroorotate dehydrogenase [Marinicrinis sediminis]|uniref:Dihydroorotate dehydrogenase n=1 Tax=Marinicrinis sediminis TaxID=1652465 RepID=A0ABW5RCN0_9BACL
MISMSCNIAGVSFKNPIIMASGTYGFGKEYSRYYALEELGGFCTKGLTLHPRVGNPGVRLYETPSGLLNSIGLENPGIASFITNETDSLQQVDTVKIVNLGGGTIEEYVEGASQLEEHARHEREKMSAVSPVPRFRSVDMIELNISCPNVKQGGMQFGIETASARTVVRAVRQVTQLPLIVKLSPLAHDIGEMAVMCEEEGADAISLINTFSGMKIDINNRKPVFHHKYAGMSGPAIRPLALRLVHLAAQAVRIPVIGMGGIVTAEDIIEFTMAGAAAVQIGTYNFVNPRAGIELRDGLEAWMKAHQVSDLAEIRGIV